jgi:hypothetical protein
MRMLSPPTDADFYGELTRSRDWRIRKASRMMSFAEMWTRGYGIFMCVLVMVFVICAMIEDYKAGTLFSW